MAKASTNRGIPRRFKLFLPALLLLSISCSEQEAVATLPNSADTAPRATAEQAMSTTTAKGEVRTDLPSSTNKPEQMSRPGDSSIVGRGWSGFDDTGETDSTPWTNEVGGSLLVFESTKAHLFKDLIGSLPSDDELYALGGGTVALEGVRDNLIEVALDENGRFGIDRIDNGPYYVCLVEGRGPYGLLGCALVDVNGPAEWNFEEGDGLFYLYVS